MALRKILILIYVFLSVCVLNAQNLSGKVLSEEGEPLVGAYLIWDGTSRGAVTDINGDFSIQRISQTSRLIASYVGYINDTIDVSGVTDIVFNLSPQIIDEVMVSARKSGSSMNRLSAITTIDVSQSELYRAACCNLGESFETNASVDVNYADAATGAKTIQMLGLSGRYVQMLVENVPNLRGMASPFGLSYIPGTWMDGIQISKGVGTVVNGYEAFTGQINIEFKKPTSTEHAFANVFAASNGRVEVNGNISQKIRDNASTAVMFSLANDFMTMDENHDGFRDEPQVKQMNFLNRWNYHNNRGYNLHLTVKTLNEERTSGQVDFAGRQPSDSLFGVFIKTDRVESWMKNAFVFSEQTNLGIATGYIYHNQHSFFGRRKYDGTQHSYNANLIFNHVFDDEERHSVHAGISSQGDFVDEKIAFNDTDKYKFSIDDLSFGAFGQYTYKYDDVFTVILGIRGDYNNNYDFFVTPRLHVRYAPTPKTIIRAAIGKGYRNGAVFMENNYLLCSSRNWEFSNVYGQESAWNMGVNITQYFDLWDKELMLNAEYYRTGFSNQMVVDMDCSVRSLYAYFSDSKSFANNIQIEAKYSPFRNFEITAAWRWNEAKQYLGGELRSRPLVSHYKGLVAVSYATPLKTWQFDANMQLGGSGRIPTTLGNPEQYVRDNVFHSYQMYNAQITKWFRLWSLYAGCENIGNFMQRNPIISSDEPMSEFFDSSLIWGPLMSRKFYFGIRWKLDY